MRLIQTIVYGLIVAVALAVVMALAHKQVNKYRVVIYAAFAIIEAYFVLSRYLGYELFTDSRAVSGLFCMGILSTALFAVVAYMGCLPPKHPVTRRLKSVRAELSVIACFIGIGQMFYYADSFVQFFEGELSAARDIATISTIVLLALLIPLMLTSFYCVRTNMSPKKWKSLQRWSYVFYFMLWLHIFGLYATIDGGFAAVFSGKHAVALEYYTVLWAVYFVLRFLRYLWDRRLAKAGGSNETEPEEA